jgi:hypothetical protein
MKLEFTTTKFNVEVYGLTDYLQVGDVVYDVKVDKTRRIFWSIDLVSFGEAINEIKFGVKGVYLSFFWDIDMSQLEEYDTLRLQSQFGASIGGDDVFGYITVDESWTLVFDGPEQLKANSAFEYRPEDVTVYVDEKRIEIK